MANRGGRAALDRLRERMTGDVEVPEDEPATIVLADDEPEPESEDGTGGVTEPEPDDDGPAIDYSHDEDEPEPAPAAKAPERPAADDAVETLRRQLAEMQGKLDAKDQADAEADKLAEDLRHVRHARGLAERAALKAKADFEKHSAAGEWSKAGDAQVALASAVADLREYQVSEADLIDEIKRPRQPAARTAPQPAQQADPFEAAVAKFSAPQQEWLRKNRADLTKTESRGKKAEAAHFEAVEQGIKVDSPAYFAHLDKVMGYENEPMSKTPSKTPKPVGKAQRAAPTSGSNAAARGSVTEVKLSRAEVDMAKQFNMTPKAYAAQKARLIENGRDDSRSGPRYSRDAHHTKR